MTLADGSAPHAPKDHRGGAPVDDAPWQRPGAEPYVRIQGVTKRFDDFVAVDDVDLDIYKGEFFSLLGASGCGKTTLLRMLAGFETPSSGRLFIDGVDVTDVPAYERPVNMMFQSYALFPHMTVEQNVAFGLRQDGVPRAEMRERVAEALDLVQLERFARRKPHQLSGGQRQRVALARSLVKRPKLLLLDEPLAALDKKLRERTQFELVNIQETVGITFVVVTHDQEEAMTMSTRIAVMKDGRILQTGPPAEIYEFPKSRYVSEFIGQVNTFEGRIAVDEADHAVIESAQSGCDIRLDHSVPGVEGQTVWVALRPEKLAITKEALEPGPNRAAGTVEEIAYLGSVSTYLVRLDTGVTVRVITQNAFRMVDRPITWEDRVWVSWPSDAAVVLHD
ncbi:MAG: polyamine ABC transporter ATP-binding protein [Azospirillaceae bacterium]